MNVANLGDTGYKLYRHDGFRVNLIYESKPQQHEFNMPYQVPTKKPLKNPKKPKIKLFRWEQEETLLLSPHPLRTQCKTSICSSCPLTAYSTISLL